MASLTSTTPAPSLQPGSGDEPGGPHLDSPPEGDWFLGIDLGTTALSAALLNRQTGKLYPVRWLPTSTAGGRSRQRARLPLVAYLAAEQWNQPVEMAAEIPLTVGDRVFELDPATLQPASAVVLRDFKSLLNLAIPYCPGSAQTWEPQIQWSEHQALTLAWVQQVIVALLSRLQAASSDSPSAAPSAPMAVELTVSQFQRAIGQLDGVMLSCPVGWSDAYRFNLREAVLATGLVAHPEQIFFAEEPIAALLGHLPSSPLAPNPGVLGRIQRNAVWQGETLVVNAGATTTDLLLVNLASEPHHLVYEDLHLRSLAYGGTAIDQDIICQLLYPALGSWEQLNLADLQLPLPGEPDLEVRHRLQQRLHSTIVGQNLLNLVKQLKLSFYEQPSVSFRFHRRQGHLSQAEVSQRVLSPYLQRLNRELNALLTQAGVAAEAVQQVILTGGTATFAEVAPWLKQKLLNATLVQATEGAAGNLCAAGLARLFCYPQLLNAVRHQYGNLFLLREMLTVLPDEPLTLGRILQRLESRGINTRVCQRSILRMLEGQLPDGLVPTEPDACWLTPASRENPIYQALSTASLFSKHSNQSYCWNPDVRDRLHHYLTTILTHTHQTLEDPLPCSLQSSPVTQFP